MWKFPVYQNKHNLSGNERDVLNLVWHYQYKQDVQGNKNVFTWHSLNPKKREKDNLPQSTCRTSAKLLISIYAKSARNELQSWCSVGNKQKSSQVLYPDLEELQILGLSLCKSSPNSCWHFISRRKWLTCSQAPFLSQPWALGTLHSLYHFCKDLFKPFCINSFWF